MIEEFKKHQSIYRDRYVKAQQEYFASIDAQDDLFPEQPLKASPKAQDKNPQQPLQSRQPHPKPE